MSAKLADKLEVGDMLLIDGVPVDIIAVDITMFTVRAILSDDPDDCLRWPHYALVNVVGRFEPVINV